MFFIFAGELYDVSLPSGSFYGAVPTMDQALRLGADALARDGNEWCEVLKIGEDSVVWCVTTPECVPCSPYQVQIRGALGAQPRRAARGTM